MAEQRFLAIINLEASSTLQRIEEDLPSVLATLNDASRTTPEIVFRSSDGCLSGFFIISNNPAGLVAARLEGSTGLTNKDGVMVVALGDDAAARCGFTRALTWLQRHH